MDPDRFDDVGYSIVEISEDARRRRLPRRGMAGLAAALVAVGAVAAAAALALTPVGSAPAPASPPRAVVPMHFAAETYPARGRQHFTALHGGNCLHLHRHPHPSAPQL